MDFKSGFWFWVWVFVLLYLLIKRERAEVWSEAGGEIVFILDMRRLRCLGGIKWIVWS